MTINRQELALGAIFIAFGLFFAGYAYLDELPFGRAARMGPGYFPVILSGILVVLGLIIVARGVRLPEETGNPVPWRGVILVLASPVFFGFVLDGLGIVPTVAIGTFFTAYASRRTTLPLALGLAVGLTAFCWVVFVYLLGVTIPAFGVWTPAIAGITR
jgi:hypothetical protein